MSFSIRLTEQDVRSIDRAGMAANIMEMGAHMREAIELTMGALDRLEDAADRQLNSVVIAGIGGSAIGGDLVRCLLHGECKIPIVVSRGYELPSFVSEKTLIVASSYSGNTEETLSQFEQAISRGARVICVTTGGMLADRAAELQLPILSQRPGLQPRAALAFSFTAILLLFERLGLAKHTSQDLASTALHLDGLAARWGVSNMNDANPAFHLAAQLMHRLPIVYSASDIYEAVNLRWRGQLQENAKHLAFGGLLPEMNHNEINGWTHPLDVLQHMSCILLRSPQDEHARVSKRCEVVKEILVGKGVPVTELFAEGNSRLERMFSLVALADWTSLFLALFNGTDPTPIPTIDLLKQKMA